MMIVSLSLKETAMFTKEKFIIIVDGINLHFIQFKGLKI